MAEKSLFCKTTIWNLLKRNEPLFGGWTVVDFIGAGAFGCVYKLEREDLGQKFTSALKVISLTRRLSRHERSIKQLEDSISQDARELVHLYSLGGHQNIVGWHNHQVFHQKDEESVTALVAVMMDYLPNSLAEEMKKGPIPWRRTIEILSDCLRGLAHIHAKSVIHRDIKPENIFITAEGTAKIGDFGVARRVSETDHAETRVGTPLYIAPEVIKDPFGHGYDFQVDIYSMGMVAYEMLTGRLPFEVECEGNKNCMVKKRLSGGTVRFETDGVPEGVQQAILGALSYDPLTRYSTALEFLESLERAVATGGQESISPLEIVIPYPDDPEAIAGSESAPEAVAPKPQPVAAEKPAPSKPAETPQSKPAASPTGNGQSSFYSDDDEDDEFFKRSKKSRTSSSSTYPPPRQNGAPASIYGDVYGSSDKGRHKVHNIGVSLFIAAVGCALALWVRDNDVSSSAVFIGVYVLAAGYLITMSYRSRVATAAVFFLSLMVYNYVYVGYSFEGILGAVEVFLLFFYIGCIFLSQLIHSYFGR